MSTKVQINYFADNANSNYWTLYDYVSILKQAWGHLISSFNAKINLSSMRTSVGSPKHSQTLSPFDIAKNIELILKSGAASGGGGGNDRPHPPGFKKKMAVDGGYTSEKQIREDCQEDS